jgi:hypothetical protein
MAVKTRSSYRRRERRIESLKRRLMRKSYPRLHASLILLLTGLAGFLVSFVLLRIGLSAMWLRYPIAILFAYGVFLILLRIWLALSRTSDWDVDVEDIVDTTVEVESYDSSTDVSTFTSTQSVSTSTTTSNSSSTGFSFNLDLDDAWWILLVIVVLLGAAIAALYVVYIAPALLAEILLDGVLMAGLYKRVKNIDHQHWLRGALSRTAVPAILIVVFFTIAGFAMQKAVPGAHSIGEVWREFTS